MFELKLRYLPSDSALHRLQILMFGLLLLILNRVYFLKNFRGGMLFDKIFAEIAATHRTQALQVPVGHIDLDVASHAVDTHRPETLGVSSKATTAAAQCTHMSAHSCFPHGRAQRISTGSSSLHMLQVKGGGCALKTPARAESTAATAARPALAKRRNALVGTSAEAEVAGAEARAAAFVSLSDR